MGQCAYKVCCAQQSWDIVNNLLLQVGTLLACLSPLVVRWSSAAVSHDWSVHEIWTAFKLLIMMSLQPSAISAPPSANCPLSLLLLCSVYSTGWGWGTSEESFIYALHTVRGLIWCIAGCLVQYWCPLWKPARGMFVVPLENLHVWRAFMRTVMDPWAQVRKPAIVCFRHASTFPQAASSDVLCGFCFYWCRLFEIAASSGGWCENRKCLSFY